MTTPTPAVPDEMTFRVERTIEINATREAAFEALLRQLGPAMAPGGQGSMDMRIEPWPGGRWYRDLGDDDGHLWGHVQVIKRPFLLEITGPMFMSTAALSHVQIRLTETAGGCSLALAHRAFGLIPPELREGADRGWGWTLDDVKKDAEGA